MKPEWIPIPEKEKSMSSAGEAQVKNGEEFVRCLAVKCALHSIIQSTMVNK